MVCHFTPKELKVKKGTIRRTLLGFTIGWTVSAAFFTPPVKTSEMVVIIVALLVVIVLDFADMR
jgi:hypothetical protein